MTPAQAQQTLTRLNHYLAVMRQIEGRQQLGMALAEDDCAALEVIKDKTRETLAELQAHKDTIALIDRAMCKSTGNGKSCGN